MGARLRRLAPGDLSEAQLEVYEAIAGGPRATGPRAFALTDDEGRLRGPFNAMLLSPPVGNAVQSVGAAVRYGSTLGDRARELAILAVAGHWDSSFEREAHEAVGRNVGLTEQEMATVRRGEIPRLADLAERAVLAATFALLKDGDMSDEEYQAAVDAVGERGAFELTTLVGYYGMLALQLRVFAGEGGGSRQAAAS